VIAPLDIAAFILFYQRNLDQVTSRLPPRQRAAMHLSPGKSNPWILFGGSYAGALFITRNPSEPFRMGPIK